MDARRTSRAVVAAVATFVAIGGCGFPDPLDEASWFVSTSSDKQSIAVGDTATLYASARYCDFVTCPAAASDTSPERFRWESFAPAIAEVSERGFLRAHRVGAARLRVTFLASNGRVPVDLWITVVPHVAAISLRLDRDTVRVGDTVRVTVRAVDESAATVPDAPVRYSYPPGMVEPAPGGSVSGPGDFVVRFQARQTGTAELFAYRDYIRHSQALYSSDTLTILP